MRTFHRLVPFCLALLCSVPALAQLKPNIMVVLDSSGSMSSLSPNLGPNSCGFGIPDAASPGQPDLRGTKGAAALCALKQVVTSTGDAEFGVLSFNGISCTGDRDDADFRVPIQTNNASNVIAELDAIGLDGATTQNFFDTVTPTGGALKAARDYFEGTFPGQAAPTAQDAQAACRSLNVVLLTDGMEQCFNACAAGADPTTGCPKAMADTSRDLSLLYCPPGCYRDATAPFPDNHFNTAQERAWELYSETTVPTPNGNIPKTVRTYVVAFGVDAQLDESRRRIESIALAGGTDNPASSTYRAYYPQNQQELTVALSQIIADAQPPDEICNGQDDDCDAKIDEGVPKFCDLPNGVTEPTLCMSPGEKNCDGIDDDCDGVIDEGLLNECGTCGDRPDEVCDGVDNDCDGNTDEGENSGMQCGSDVGACMPGTIVCIAGGERCEGEIGPTPELCDCTDNDCDGRVDEDVDGSLCGGGQCFGCTCVDPCTAGIEFEATCADGFATEFLDNRSCICVKDDCDRDACRADTLTRDGKIACAPDSDDVGTCRCRGGACTAPCDGVTCGSDSVCSSDYGRCVPNDCRGLGCEEDERCNPGTGKCESDPCADVTCDDNMACRDGRCEASCADVVCEEGTCNAGTCQTDACADETCGGLQVCDRQTRTCVRDRCLSQSCEAGLVCEPVSGECVTDPCLNLHCPAEQRCQDGQCRYSIPRPPPTQSTGGTVETDESASQKTRVLATGGSGCLCHLSATQQRPVGGRAWFGLGLVGLLVTRRLFGRRRPGSRVSLRTAYMLLLAVLVLTVAAGCKVSPYCIDCIDSDGQRSTRHADSGTGTGGAQATGGHTNTGGSHALDSGMADSGPLGTGGEQDSGPVCKPTAEVCNDQDDDCDFKVDEQVNPTENNCSQQGACAGSRPVCLAGEFVCRFGPDYETPDELSCDDLDNDCDGRIDETYGQKGAPCELGVGTCKRSGRLVCAATAIALRCDATPGDPRLEICDNLDNDCDGLIDEPKNNAGADPSYVQDHFAKVSDDLYVYAYEASRVDATDASPGRLTTRACSRTGTVPWTNVTYEEAQQACTDAGLRLCSAADWQTACEGTAATADERCLWSYLDPTSSSCPTTANSASVSYPSSDACNGHNLNAPSRPIGAPGASDVDQLKATGTMARCYTQHGGDRAFDLSGNAKEWVDDPNVSGQARALRGGSHNDLPEAMRCGFSLGAANLDVRLPTIGFRCCTDQAP